MSHRVRSRLKRAVHISAATAVVCILAYISEAVVATVNILTVVATINILTVVATVNILTVVITDARTVALNTPVARAAALNTPVAMTCVFKPSVVKMVSHSHMFNAVVAEPVLMSVVITMTAVHSPTVSSTV